jgi:hypothetical protein
VTAYYPGEFGDVKGRPAELVGPITGLVLEQRRGGRRGVVMSRGGREFAVAAGADDLAALEVLGQRIGVDLRVVTVAQKSKRHVSLTQHLLRVTVLAGQRASRGINIEHARVDDPRDSSGLGGLDDVAVVSDLVARSA